MACGVCGKQGHNAKTCPYDAKRRPFSRKAKKSKRCQCCGQYGYAIEAHHTRGRSDNSDRLDVCVDCQLRCGHKGLWRNIPIKPQVCRIMNRDSYWRGN